MPTLAESNTERRVAGTSFYQKTLAEVAQHLRTRPPVVDLVTVQLALLEHGEYAGAVGVYLVGSRVGSIPADSADEYRPVVSDLTKAGRPATCRATLVGGGAMRDGDGFLNVGLWILQPAHPAVAGPDAPFLPQHVGTRVSVDPQTAARLDAALPSRAKRFVRRVTGQLAPDGTVEVDGEVVGQVVDDIKRVPEVVVAAHEAGYPSTCGVRMIREPGRQLRVAIDVPHFWWPEPAA